MELVLSKCNSIEYLYVKTRKVNPEVRMTFDD